MDTYARFNRNELKEKEKKKGKGSLDAFHEHEFWDVHSYKKAHFKIESAFFTGDTSSDSDDETAKHRVHAMHAMRIVYVQATEDRASPPHRAIKPPPSLSTLRTSLQAGAALFCLACLDPGSDRKIPAVWNGAGANPGVFIPET